VKTRPQRSMIGLKKVGHSRSAHTVTAAQSGRAVFIVHGHDEAARETTARYLERLGLEAVILHEQVNQGRTIIEKLEQSSNVEFAVVLLTPELPSDFLGVVYVPMDSAGGWRLLLARELKGAGFAIDLNEAV